MQVGLIGSGNMARALARGWGEHVLCSHGGSGSARDLVRELGGEAFDSNVEVADRADLVVRRAVTSPRGTTARGLAALERGGVRPVFQDAFDAVIDWFR